MQRRHQVWADTCPDTVSFTRLWTVEAPDKENEACYWTVGLWQEGFVRGVGVWGGGGDTTAHTAPHG